MTRCRHCGYERTTRRGIVICPKCGRPGPGGGPDKPKGGGGQPKPVPRPRTAVVAPFTRAA